MPVSPQLFIAALVGNVPALAAGRGSGALPPRWAAGLDRSSGYLWAAFALGLALGALVGLLETFHP